MSEVDRRLRPRNSPRQARSAETRRRILEAAARVFGEYGYAAGTTNRIAAAAGLSIGSLYQYFPNKDAILVELMRRHVDEGASMVQWHLERAGGLPPRLEDRLRLFVQAAVDAHAGDPGLHQVLFEQSPRPKVLLDRLHEMEAILVQTVSALLAEDPRVSRDPALAGWMVVAAIESLTHRFVSSRRTDLDAATFADELVTLLAAYLTR